MHSVTLKEVLEKLELTTAEEMRLTLLNIPLVKIESSIEELGISVLLKLAFEKLLDFIITAANLASSKFVPVILESVIMTLSRYCPEKFAPLRSHLLHLPSLKKVFKCSSS